MNQLPAHVGDRAVAVLFPPTIALRPALVALYGNTVMPKVYCSPCRRYAFLIGGFLQCCDREVHDFVPEKYKRESEPEQKRRTPPKRERDAQLALQDYRCFYCENAFEDFVRLGERWLRVQLCWDHLVPFSYAQDNTTANFVAACRQCNRIKHAKMFQTVDDARIYILEQRSGRGFKPC